MVANTCVLDLELASSISGRPLTISSRLHTNRLQQAIEKFHRNLSPEEIAKLSIIPPGPQSILNLILEVDGKGKKRRLRRLASYFQPFLESIERCARAGDVLVSSNPQIAALVWGSVSAVITVRPLVPVEIASFRLMNSPDRTQFLQLFSKPRGNVSDDWKRVPSHERIPGALWGICGAS